MPTAVGAATAGAGPRGLGAVTFEEGTATGEVHRSPLARSGVHVPKSMDTRALAEHMDTRALAEHDGHELPFALGRPRRRGAMRTAIDPVAVRRPPKTPAAPARGSRPPTPGGAMRTRAAVLSAFPAERPYARSRPLSIEAVELDDPGPGEVLVRVMAAGLCHSDLSVIDGNRPRPMPMALGHEAAGVVERTGEGVDDLAPGDHVVMVFVPSCGHCGPCAEGRPALCEPGARANAAGTLLSGARRLSRNGAPLHHHLGASAFAEHAVVSRRSLVRADPDLPFATAALFGCAVLTGVGAVVNTGALSAGETVAVVGLGGVGLAAVLGALAAGASQVIGLDVEPAKLTAAESLGATATFSSREPGCIEVVREATGGGVDLAVETAGVVPALEAALAITRRGGRTATAGLARPDARLALSPLALVAEERTLRGCYLGGGVPSRDIRRAMALHGAGRLPVERLRSGTGRLSEINEGFDLLASGRAVRHVIEMDA